MVVRARTYSEAVSVIGTAAVTIIVDSSNLSNYAQNEVTILSHTANIPISIGTNSV